MRSIALTFPIVMAGLASAIHVLAAERRGCPGPGYAKGFAGLSMLGRRSFSEDGKPGHDE
jgi:hypothetical protein